VKILYLIDPLKTLTPPTDTALLLIKEAAKRRYRNYTAEHSDLRVKNGIPSVSAVETGIDKKGSGMPKSQPQHVDLNFFDAIVFRHNPPFDVDYLHATQIVDLAKCGTVLNSTHGLRAANEKLYALNFPEAMPETILTKSKDEAVAFLADVKAVVAKPLDSFGGVGVVMMRTGDIGARSLIDLMTAEGTRHALFQKYIKGVDKRVFVIDGRVEGVMLRVGAATDFRQNMHLGGQPTLGELTPIEKRRIDSILPRLKSDGLNFVGLDLIGGFLSEINVTSPTGFWHYQKVSRRMLTREVVDMLTRMAEN